MIKKMMFIETLLKYDFILIPNLTYHLDQSQYENLMNSQNLMKTIQMNNLMMILLDLTLLT